MEIFWFLNPAREKMLKFKKNLLHNALLIILSAILFYLVLKSFSLYFIIISSLLLVVLLVGNVIYDTYLHNKKNNFFIKLNSKDLSPELLKQELLQGNKITAHNDNGQKVFDKIISNRKIPHGKSEKVIKFALESGANINSLSGLGVTPLISAMHNNPKIVGCLLDYPEIDHNKSDKNGTTPLMLAISLKRHDIVNRLINMKAKVNPINKFGFSALRYAILYGDVELVNKLANSKEGLDIVYKDGRTLLMLAATANKPSIVSYLLEQGVERDFLDNNGMNALWHGVRSNSIDCLRVLIDHGSNVNIKNKYGISPLDTALICKNTDVVNFLLSKGAIPSTNSYNYSM